MPQSLARILVHLIFSTKNRCAWIRDEVRPDLHAYAAGILKGMDSPAITMNSVDNHIHILFLQSRNHSLADIIEEVKKQSSKWIKTKGTCYSKFYWQSGYGAFSVSESRRKDAERYIARQAVHHKTTTFEDEFRAFLRKYNIEFDERYVWD